MQRKSAILFLLLVTFILCGRAQSQEKMAQSLPGKEENKTVLVKTIFTLQIEDPAFQADTSFKSLTIETITNRLRGVYSGKILPEDLTLDSGKVLLRLNGEVNADEVKKRLNRKTEIRFLPGYKDVPGMLAQLKAKGAEKWLSFPPEGITHFTYLGKMAHKDTSEVRKMVQQIRVSKNLHWYFINRWDDTSELYLLDEEHPVINNGEVVHVAQQYDKMFNAATGNLVLNESGKIKLAAYTKDNIGGMLTIIANGQLILAAIISGEISWGKMSIANGATVEEMTKLMDEIGYPFPTALKVTSVKTE